MNLEPVFFFVRPGNVSKQTGLAKTVLVSRSVCRYESSDVSLRTATRNREPQPDTGARDPQQESP
jgi:hypothetical protein